VTVPADIDLEPVLGGRGELSTSNPCRL